MANISHVDVGCPTVIVNKYLGTFFPQNALKFYQILFNLSEDTIEEHQDTMCRVAGKLAKTKVRLDFHLANAA
jgi:hypothetical protein